MNELYVKMTDEEYTHYKEYLSNKGNKSLNEYNVGELSAALFKRIQFEGGELDNALQTNGKVQVGNLTSDRMIVSLRVLIKN